MIAGAAHLVLLFLEGILIACSLLVAAVFAYAWWVRHWDAFELRRQAKADHTAARRKADIAARISEMHTVADRDHPLHSLGGRFR